VVRVLELEDSVWKDDAAGTHRRIGNFNPCLLTIVVQAQRAVSSHVRPPGGAQMVGGVSVPCFTGLDRLKTDKIFTSYSWFHCETLCFHMTDAHAARPRQRETESREERDLRSKGTKGEMLTVAQSSQRQIGLGIEQAASECAPERRRHKASPVCRMRGRPVEAVAFDVLSKPHRGGRPDTKGPHQRAKLKVDQRNFLFRRHVPTPVVLASQDGVLTSTKHFQGGGEARSQGGLRN
ncbi:unnamed protein product, partial [Pleuronectes platessa]